MPIPYKRSQLEEDIISKLSQTPGLGKALEMFGLGGPPDVMPDVSMMTAPAAGAITRWVSQRGVPKAAPRITGYEPAAQEALEEFVSRFPNVVKEFGEELFTTFKVQGSYIPRALGGTGTRVAVDPSQTATQILATLKHEATHLMRERMGKDKTMDYVAYMRGDPNAIGRIERPAYLATVNELVRKGELNTASDELATYFFRAAEDNPELQDAFLKQLEKILKRRGLEYTGGTVHSIGK